MRFFKILLLFSLQVVSKNVDTCEKESEVKVIFVNDTPDDVQVILIKNTQRTFTLFNDLTTSVDIVYNGNSEDHLKPNEKGFWDSTLGDIWDVMLPNTDTLLTRIRIAGAMHDIYSVTSSGIISDLEASDLEAFDDKSENYRVNANIGGIRSGTRAQFPELAIGDICQFNNAFDRTVFRVMNITLSAGKVEDTSRVYSVSGKNPESETWNQIYPRDPISLPMRVPGSPGEKFEISSNTPYWDPRGDDMIKKITFSLAQERKLGMGVGGLEVTSILPGSLSDAGGVQVGWRVTSFDGEIIGTDSKRLHQLLSELSGSEVDQIEIEFTYTDLYFRCISTKKIRMRNFRSMDKRADGDAMLVYPGDIVHAVNLVGNWIGLANGKFIPIRNKKNVLLFLPVPADFSEHSHTIEIIPLSNNLRIWKIPEFAKATESKKIISMCKTRMVESKVGSGDSTSSRRSSTCVLHSEETIVKHFMTRVYEVLNVTTEQGKKSCEPLQVVRYEEGGFFGEHYDYFLPNLNMEYPSVQGGSNRFATVMFYLTSPAEGGTTTFPKAFDENGNIIVVEPKEGQAIFWYNTDTEGNLQPNSLHRGDPVVQGKKWIATSYCWDLVD